MTVVAHNAGGIEAVLLFLREKEAFASDYREPRTRY
jgi:hypothetical protein